MTAEDYLEPGVEGAVATLEFTQIAELTGSTWIRPVLGRFNAWERTPSSETAVEFADVWETSDGAVARSSVSAAAWAAAGHTVTTAVALVRLPG